MNRILIGVLIVVGILSIDLLVFAQYDAEELQAQKCAAIAKMYPGLPTPKVCGGNGSDSGGGGKGGGGIGGGGIFKRSMGGVVGGVVGVPVIKFFQGLVNPPQTIKTPCVNQPSALLQYPYSSLPLYRGGATTYQLPYAGGAHSFNVPYTPPRSQ